uniref:Uncharacterized protein n=1 Tax=Rhizophora mucronata TaxID=61149 RepID=A0A2P2N5B4_RHIMU
MQELIDYHNQMPILNSSANLSSNHSHNLRFSRIFYLQQK